MITNKFNVTNKAIKFNLTFLSKNGFAFVEDWRTGNGTMAGGYRGGI